MPLTSFNSVPQPVAPAHELTFRLGKPDVGEAAGVADQAMYELGLAGPDRDKNLEEITADFNKLTVPGYDGLLYPLPNQAVPFDHILATADGKRPDGVPAVLKHSNLWVPGTEEQSYTEAELNAGSANHVARLAVFTSLETDVDPVLHDLGRPYDSYKDEYECIDVNPDGDRTQLEALAADKAAFVLQHESYTLDPLDHKAFAMLTLMDRIRGVKKIKSEKQILARGYIRIPVLGRRAVRGTSLVGVVYSNDGQLRLDGSVGNADSNFGVGRSMGLVES